MKRAHKKRRLWWLDVAVVFVTVALVGFGLWYTFAKKSNGSLCDAVGTEHQLTVGSDAFSAERLTLQRCDTVKIVNIGAEDYDLAFGVHDRHVAYPGFSMQLLRPNEFFVIDAVQAGTYTMHDHLRDEAHIEFEIKDR